MLKRELIKKIHNGFKNKKVLLTSLDSPFLDSQYVFPYLGILYLAAVAADVGMRVRYINTRQEYFNKNILSESDFFYTDEFDMNNIDQYEDIDIIGISCMTPQGDQAYRIRKALKNKYPNKMIILGGPHAKYYLDECKKEGFDVIVAGDGERIFRDLLIGDIDSLSSNLDLQSSEDSLIFQDYLTKDEMNEFPIPYREKSYLDKYNYLLQGAKATTLVNSRGCPMGCAFCEDRRTQGRWFSPSHFEEEIQTIVENGINAIMIFDDLFTISPKKLQPYAEILKKFHKKKSLIYRCFGHAKIITDYPEILDLLRESGCVEIGFGAESASQEILNTVYKGNKVEEMHACVENTIRAGIRIKAFFMIGLPGETKETFQETYNFIERYRTKYPDSFDFDLAVFFPYKGTLIGDTVRLPEGEKITLHNQKIDHTFFKIRLKEGLSWKEVDSGNYGAYKKKGGESDVVIETYDWEKEMLLLSADQINELKERVMCLSKRYSDGKGNRVFSPKGEGNIGSIFLK